MKFKISLTRMHQLVRSEVCDCEMCPKWYHGYSYRKWDYDRTVFHIIPFNYVIRFAMFIKHQWNKFRSTPGYVDKQVFILDNEYNIKWRKLWREYFENKFELAIEIELKKLRDEFRQQCAGQKN